jgi:hypothetical protein
VVVDREEGGEPPDHEEVPEDHDEQPDRPDAPPGRPLDRAAEHERDGEARDGVDEVDRGVAIGALQVRVREHPHDPERHRHRDVCDRGALHAVPSRCRMFRVF